MITDITRERIGHYDIWDRSEYLSDEEIVRCCDCSHCRMDGGKLWCAENDRDVDDADFCSWGERRGG